MLFRSNRFSKKHVIWLLVIITLSIAGGLVFALKSVKNEAELLVPIKISNIPDQLIVSDLPVKGIEIQILASKRIIAEVMRSKLLYHLMISQTEPGIVTIPVEISKINLPDGVLVESTNPSSLTLKIEKKITKRVPIIVQSTGKPAPGYYLADAKPIPDTVIISGPESLVAPIETIFTETIEITGKSKDFKKESALSIPENVVVESMTEIVLAQVTIAEKQIAQTIKNLSVVGKNSTYMYDIMPPSMEIEVKGPVHTLKKADLANTLKAYVDLSGLKPGVYVRRATISLPVKTVLLRAHPEVFTVKIIQRK